MNYLEIKEKLKVPVPQELISHRPQGGISIAYVNVTDYKELLDERTGGIWESQILDFKQIGESICVVVRLTIHADDGAFIQDGSGIESLNMSGYGDPFSNAYAQAFRRACEGHGLSRELWLKEEVNTETTTRKPNNNGNNNGNGKITEKQEKFIFDLCNKTGSLSPKVASHFSNNRTDKIEELTFAEAKSAIDGLLKKPQTEAQN